MLMLSEALEKFNIKKASDYVWLKISGLDLYIQQHEPFKKIKNPDTEKLAREDIVFLLRELYQISILLEPLLPNTAKKISEAILAGSLGTQLFPRIQ